MKIGIIREGKTPPDSRVPLIPSQCAFIKDAGFVENLKVQPSKGRCFSDEEYQEYGITLSDDVSDCDVLIGVKEVPIDELMENKTYFFFSHTIKKQVYNRKLLQACVAKNIRLIDYEALRDADGNRLIAFGYFAGMVGAHNAVMTYGSRTGAYHLPRMHSYYDYLEAQAYYKLLDIPNIKIVLTGTGRVGSGAAKVLMDMGIMKVSSQDFFNQTFKMPVFTQLNCEDYVTRKDGGEFNGDEFYTKPELYKSIFTPYVRTADLMINGIFWDNRAPALFELSDMRLSSFKLQAIADITCDIAPKSSVPSTIEASTISDPIFGFDPITQNKVLAHTEGAIDMMTIDNLPNELPRDASKAFGKQFIEHIIPEFVKNESEIINKATVTISGDLGLHFEYLRDYLNGTES